MNKAEFFVKELKRDLLDDELSFSFQRLLDEDISCLTDEHPFKIIATTYRQLKKDGKETAFNQYVRQAVVNTVAMMLAGFDDSFDIGAIQEKFRLYLGETLISGSLKEEFFAVLEDDID